MINGDPIHKAAPSLQATLRYICTTISGAQKAEFDIVEAEITHGPGVQVSFISCFLVTLLLSESKVITYCKTTATRNIRGATLVVLIR